MDGMKILCSVLALVLGVTFSDAGECYQFSGSEHVTFNYNFDNRTGVHFKLKFKTGADSGVLYYAEGNYHRERTYDYEGVFLRDGYVHYFLFNPGIYSIGSSFGFNGKSSMQLNDGNWHSLEFYRNKEVEVLQDNGMKKTVNQIGITVDGKQQAVDNRWREGVNFLPKVILGHDPHLEERNNKSIGGFKGSIQDFEEVIKSHVFDSSQEIASQVKHCVNIENPKAT